MKTKLLFSLIVCLLLLGVKSYAQEITEAVICKNVEELEAVEPTESFLKGDKAYCWLKVSNATVGSQITINWYHGENLEHSKELEMKYESMRTYAFKTLFHAGKWRADVISADGTVLKSLTFEAVE